MKQTITSITVLILGFTSIFLGLSIIRLQDRYLKMSCEIGRLEKQIQLISESSKTIGYRVLPNGDDMLPPQYRQLLSNYFTITLIDCVNK